MLVAAGWRENEQGVSLNLWSLVREKIWNFSRCLTGGVLNLGDDIRITEEIRFIFHGCLQ